MPNNLFRSAKVVGRTRRRRTAGAAVAAVLLGLSLAACGAAVPGQGPGSAEDKPVVLTTFTVLADVAQNVAGDKLQVESITKAGAE
ncbi:MAG TPA: metal ABC transporter substrate-binding protein, partial [Arthrobacter sp.]|nr:metal ABC transporter substrate-binding protein [Arthrobacter sp.]